MKIYDAFLFFNEVDLLKVRLEELYNHVDGFIIVESPRAFCGVEKPLYFSEYRSEFAQYEEKLHHFVWDEALPPRSLQREQRNFLKTAVLEVGARDEDIVIISDVDEIPRGEKIDLLPDLLSLNEYVVFVQNYHFGFLNWRHIPDTWCGSVATKVSTLKLATPEDVRWGEECARGRSLVQRSGCDYELADKEHPLILDGGWHFSWQGGPDAALYKRQTLMTHELRRLGWLRSGTRYVLRSNCRGNLQNNVKNPFPLEALYSDHRYAEIPIEADSFDLRGLDLPQAIAKNPTSFAHLFRFAHATKDESVDIPWGSVNQTIRRKLLGLRYALESPFVKIASLFTRRKSRSS